MNVTIVENFLHGIKTYRKLRRSAWVINNFNNKNLKSFEDNFNSKGDLSFAMYFYFETTATTNNIFDPEQNKIFFVSYVLIVAFCPKLNLKKIDAFVKIQYERKNPIS